MLNNWNMWVWWFFNEDEEDEETPTETDKTVSEEVIWSGS